MTSHMPEIHQKVCYTGFPPGYFLRFLATFRDETRKNHPQLTKKLAVTSYILTLGTRSNTCTVPNLQNRLKPTTTSSAVRPPAQPDGLQCFGSKHW